MYASPYLFYYVGRDLVRLFFMCLVLSLGIYGCILLFS